MWWLFSNNLQLFDAFLRVFLFPSPIKLTTIWLKQLYIYVSGIKHKINDNNQIKLIFVDTRVYM
jgi:hypothetical protein